MASIANQPAYNGFGEYPEPYDVKYANEQKQKIKNICFYVFQGSSLGAKTALICALSRRVNLRKSFKIGAAVAGVYSIATIATQTALSYFKSPRIAPSTHTLGLNATLHQATPTGIYTNDNSVLITKSADESTEWKFKLFAEAKQSIEISGSYCFGEVFLKALGAFTDAIRNNPQLQIRLLALKVVMGSEDYKACEALRKNYPNNFHVVYTYVTAHFYPKTGFTDNHTKILVVDEKVCMIGGTNLADRMNSGIIPPKEKIQPFDYLCGLAYIDMDAICIGASAKTARLEFYKLYATLEFSQSNNPELINHYQPIDTSKPVGAFEFLTDHPEIINKVETKLTITGPENHRRFCSEEYAEIYTQAKKTIKIANLFFNPVKPVNDALLYALTRNVALMVISNSPKTALFKNLWAWRNRYHYLRFKEANKRTLFYEYCPRSQQSGKPVNKTFHSKITVVDDEIVVVGNYNHSLRSHLGDYEAMFTFKNKDVASRISDLIDSYLGDCEFVPSSLVAQYNKSLVYGTIGKLEDKLASAIL